MNGLRGSLWEARPVFTYMDPVCWNIIFWGISLLPSLSQNEPRSLGKYVTWSYCLTSASFLSWQLTAFGDKTKLWPCLQYAMARKQVSEYPSERPNTIVRLSAWNLIGVGFLIRGGDFKQASFGCFWRHGKFKCVLWTSLAKPPRKPATHHSLSNSKPFVKKTVTKEGEWMNSQHDQQ